MKYIVSAMSSAALVAALFSAPAFSVEDGNVDFEGSIMDASCIVDLDGVGGTRLNVQLGNIPKSSFRGEGSTTSATQFNITLKNCPNTVSAAKVKFDGIGYNGGNAALQLTQGQGVATGVAIQLSDRTGVLPLRTDSAPYPLTDTAPNILDFYARYLQTEATIQPGTASSTASFTVSY